MNRKLKSSKKITEKKDEISTEPTKSSEVNGLEQDSSIPSNS